MGRRDASQGLYTAVGLGHRIQALLIDAVLLMGLLVLCFSVVFGFPSSVEVGSLADFVPPLTAMTWLDWLFTLLFPHGLIMIFWLVLGATPGKLYLGAIIIDNRTGLRPRSWQYVVRYLCASAPFLAALLIGRDELLLGYSAYPLMLVSRRRRAWHDFCSGTLVVRPIGSGSQIIRFERQSPGGQ